MLIRLSLLRIEVTSEVPLRMTYAIIILPLHTSNRTVRGGVFMITMITVSLVTGFFGSLAATYIYDKYLR